METDIRKEMENTFMLYKLVVRKKIVRKKIVQKELTMKH